jgi:probable F420-dependent oxidoreductase
VSDTFRPFRFGMSGTQWGPHESGTDQRAYLQSEATRAEAAGFDVLTFADHTVPGMRPPLTTVLCAAEAVRSLRFGTLVLNNDFWNPLLLAREVATIAALTGGRFELGIGAGHAKPDYDNAGLQYDPPSVRVDRLAEALPLLQQLLRGGTVTHQGTHYSLVDANTGLPEGATPHVPIVVGGNGTRVLRLGGQYADIVSFSGLLRNIDFGHAHQPDWTVDYLDNRIDVVREAADMRFADIELNALLQWVYETDDREAAAAGFCKEVEPLGIHLSVEDAMNTPFLLFGTIEEMAASLHHSRERFGISYFTARPDGFDTMAKVIACARR